MENRVYQFFRPYLVIALLSVLIDWILGYGLLTMLVLTLFYAFRQGKNYQRLMKWYEKGSKPSAFPDLSGFWYEIASYAYQLQKASQKRKKQLARIVKRFHRSTEAMPDGTVVLNRYHEIEWANSAASKLLGINTKGDIGQRIDNLVREPRFIKFLQKKNFDKSLEIVSPVDDTVDLNVRIVPYDKDSLLLSARDISERNRINAMRKDFIANVSHEFRTPLTVLQGHVELLENSCPQGTPQHESIIAIQKQLQRTNQLVDDLIQLSKYESTSFQDHVEGSKVAVCKLLESVIQQYQLPECTIELQCDEDFYLEVVESEVKTTIENLINNAIKHNPGKLLIKVDAHKDELGGYISITDNGRGIAREHIDRLTERFYRIDQGESKTPGSGLGLSLVKHILNRHDAALRISSTLGKGSQFICEFPLSRVL